MTRKRKNPQKGKEQTGITSLVRDFKPKTPGQAEYIRAIGEHDVVICDGPAGTGKTACAVALACEYLVYGKVKKVVITRPIVETGYSMGFLPGSLEEKIHPYLVPILDEIEDYFGKDKAEQLIHTKVIDIVPLNFMRGRNLHESFLILDEAQNCTYDQLKMAISRIGRKSKCIINGDHSQSDLPKDYKDTFTNFYEKLKNVENVSIVKLEKQDIVRNPVIAHILARL